MGQSFLVVMNEKIELLQKEGKRTKETLTLFEGGGAERGHHRIGFSEGRSAVENKRVNNEEINKIKK